MKKLGLVGGMGLESTIPYYHDLLYGYQKLTGSSEFPQMTIESVDVFHILNYCKNQQYEELTDYLTSAIMNLYHAGAEFAALASNTPHIVFDKLKRRSPIPLVSILDTACEEVKARKLHKIGLLGTIFTMEGDFYKAPFLNNGIEIVVPDSEERISINDHITNEIEHGILLDSTKQLLLDIISRMVKEDYIEAVILGCTELPLLLTDGDGPVPFLDTMQIHIKALIKLMAEKY